MSVTLTTKELSWLMVAGASAAVSPEKAGIIGTEIMNFTASKLMDIHGEGRVRNAIRTMGIEFRNTGCVPSVGELAEIVAKLLEAS